MATRILIADDHRIVRDGLRTWLSQQSDMEVVGEASDGRTAVKLTEELHPDIVVMDISMPDLNGVEAARQIAGLDLRTKVIALSMHADRSHVSRMFQAGAVGYLLKDCAVDELRDAIRSVLDGQVYLSGQITGVVIDDYVHKLEQGRDVGGDQLTPREREVLQLLAEGKTTKQAALDLKVSAKTIETHRQHIMAKLNFNSIAELTKYAIREGYTSLDQ